MSHGDWERKNEEFKAEAKRLGHEPLLKETSYMTDACFCSCGWRSNDYWDGDVFAYQEWQKHVRESMETGQKHLPITLPKREPGLD